jgi:hypothetical protein
LPIKNLFTFLIILHLDSYDDVFINIKLTSEYINICLYDTWFRQGLFFD